MKPEEIQKKVNTALNLSDIGQACRGAIIESRYGGKYSVFNFYSLDEQYTLTDITHFFKENKKLLFKKGDKQQKELYNTWSKSQYERLINMIISYSLLKGLDLDKTLDELSLITREIENNNFSQDSSLHDIHILKKYKEESDFDYDVVSHIFLENSFKEYVYKYILSKAVLNDGKGHFYTSDELHYIADLRYKKSDLRAFAEEYNDICDKNLQTIPPFQIRGLIKRRIELTIILFLLEESIFPQEYRDNFIGKLDSVIEAEAPSPCGMIYASYMGIMHSMTTGKDEYLIEKSVLLSPFYYLPQVEKLLLFLGRLLGDSDLKKIK